MMGRQKVSSGRLPLKIFAVFALAFALQGLNLALFGGHRRPHVTEEAGPRSVRMNAPVLPLDVFLVTSTEDGGLGSLRQAIADANNSPGFDEILFQFDKPVTLTLGSNLVITDPVYIEAHGPWYTDTYPGWLTIDAADVTESVFVIEDAPGTFIRRLRLVNVANGYGIHVLGSSQGTELSRNAILAGFGGILLDNTSHITVTHNVLINLLDAGLEARNSSNLALLRNRIRSRIHGVRLLDGVSNVAVISNTLTGGIDEQTIGILAVGDPPPVGISMRGNSYLTTTVPISLGQGANYDFPTPQILEAFRPFTTTAPVEITALSPAHPSTYAYPLKMDTYLVRDGRFTPVGKTQLYQRSDFPNPITYTVFYTDVLSTDQLALIATTANPNTSEFSPTVQIIQGPLPGVSLWVKAFLEGPYNRLTHEMRTDLADAGVLPLSQPFADPLYDGTVLDYDEPMSVPSHPDSTVDWILVNLRTNPDSASTIAEATHPAVVFEGGTVVSIGEDSLRFAGVPDGDYYLVLRSRNHLDIMNTVPIVVEAGIGSYDFTEAGAAFGEEPQKLLEEGIWGMYACDVDTDGTVGAPELDLYLFQAAHGAAGYEPADFNLDVEVQALDINLCIANAKAGVSSQVP